MRSLTRSTTRRALAGPAVALEGLFRPKLTMAPGVTLQCTAVSPTVEVIKDPEHIPVFV